MAADGDFYKLSSPRIFLIRMLVFLTLVTLICVILYREILRAFLANPGLNGLIAGVLFIGILLGLRQVARLFPEIAWVNALHAGTLAAVRSPVLLAPMATMLGDKAGTKTISTHTLRAILDSVGSRLDEARETARYLTGLLIFLGLLGTFWGLLQTVASLSTVLAALKTSGEGTASLSDLVNGLRPMFDGISLSFSASLFGLAGSLVLGFLDLQAGQAQNRFYNELEDNLSANTAETAVESSGASAMPANLQTALAKLGAGTDQTQARASAAAMANLAEGIQGLVQHMRSEQQLVRDWVEAQAAQQKEIKRLLERLASVPERR